MKRLRNEDEDATSTKECLWNDLLLPELRAKIRAALCITGRRALAATCQAELAQAHADRVKIESVVMTTWTARYRAFLYDRAYWPVARRCIALRGVDDAAIEHAANADDRYQLQLWAHLGVKVWGQRTLHVLMSRNHFDTVKLHYESAESIVERGRMCSTLARYMIGHANLEGFQWLAAMDSTVKFFDLAFPHVLTLRRTDFLDEYVRIRANAEDVPPICAEHVLDSVSKMLRDVNYVPILEHLRLKHGIEYTGALFHCLFAHRRTVECAHLLKWITTSIVLDCFRGLVRSCTSLVSDDENAVQSVLSVADAVENAMMFIFAVRDIGLTSSHVLAAHDHQRRGDVWNRQYTRAAWARLSTVWLPPGGGGGDKAMRLLVDGETLSDALTCLAEKNGMSITEYCRPLRIEWASYTDAAQSMGLRATPTHFVHATVRRNVHQLELAMDNADDSLRAILDADDPDAILLDLKTHGAGAGDVAALKNIAETTVYRSIYDAIVRYFGICDVPWATLARVYACIAHDCPYEELVELSTAVVRRETASWDTGDVSYSDTDTQRLLVAAIVSNDNELIGRVATHLSATGLGLGAQYLLYPIMNDNATALGLLKEFMAPNWQASVISTIRDKSAIKCLRYILDEGHALDHMELLLFLDCMPVMSGHIFFVEYRDVLLKQHHALFRCPYSPTGYIISYEMASSAMKMKYSTAITWLLEKGLWPREFPRGSSLFSQPLLIERFIDAGYLVSKEEEEKLKLYREFVAKNKIVH